MHEAEVYVVRVYRRDASGVSGVVEDIRQCTSTAFRSAKDLIDVILGQRAAGDSGGGDDEDNF